MDQIFIKLNHIESNLIKMDHIVHPRYARYFRPIKMFSCRPSINKNKDLENWNSNILGVPMSHKLQII